MAGRAEPWGVTPDGAAVDLVTLANAVGTTARIATYGATLVRLQHGSPPVDLVLGFDDLGGYLATQPYLGATVGRYANRIAHGRLVLDGREHRLSRNEGAHTLHGGAVGFDRAVWRVSNVQRDAVELVHVSADGDQGFPGTLTCSV